MMKRTAYLAVAAVASILSLASNRAEACSDISNAALDIIADGTAAGYGASFFTDSVKAAFSYDSSYTNYMWGANYPSSASYFDHIVAGNYFSQVNNVGSIQAGDAFVVDQAGTYSGHTAIAIGAPVQVFPPLNPIITGTKQWALPIADSTGSPHGCAGSYASKYPDSRCAAGTTGPGTGYLRIYADATTGAFTGHTWSVGSQTLTNYYAVDVRPYVLGRVTPCPPL